jgi:4-amino-4-deoxy-L-arabinose transferase-like glycosyltransferase
MNQINDPDPITNTQARHKLARIAPIVLAIDLILAAIIWFMKEAIFKEQADYLGGMIAGALIIAGVFSFVILRLMAHKITQSDRVRDHKDDL